MTPEEIENIYLQIAPAGEEVPFSSLGAQLSNRGIQFHDLSKLSLMAAIIGQSRLFHLPSGLEILNHDNRCLWAWCGELLVNAPTLLSGAERNLHLESLFSIALHSVQAESPSPPRTKGPCNYLHQHLYEAATELYSHHARAVIGAAGDLIILHLSFPLLEAVIKKKLADYVRPDGEVIKEFSLPSRTYKVGKRINSIKDLLLQLDKTESGSALQLRIRSLSEIIAATGDHKDGFEKIYAWRNSALHGDESVKVGATILNMALLIGLDMISDFEKRRVDALGLVNFWGPKKNRPNWSHYPPAYSAH